MVNWIFFFPTLLCYNCAWDGKEREEDSDCLRRWLCHISVASLSLTDQSNQRRLFLRTGGAGVQPALVNLCADPGRPPPHRVTAHPTVSLCSPSTPSTPWRPEIMLQVQAEDYSADSGGLRRRSTHVLSSWWDKSHLFSFILIWLDFFFISLASFFLIKNI